MIDLKSDVQGLCSFPECGVGEFETCDGQFLRKNAKITKWLVISHAKKSLVTLICLERAEFTSLEGLKVIVWKSYNVK